METTNNLPQQAAQQQAASITTMMSNQNVKNRFNELLGKKAPGFISSVLSVAKTPAMAEAVPSTILNAAVVAATLDLPINPNLGFAYIVPYNNKKTKTMEAQFQMGYKGFIQLAQRSGQYKTINATDVREGELISNDILSGEIQIKAVADREKKSVIGYAAFFELLNGFRKTLYMSAEEMKEHAKAYSQSYKFDKYGTSLWTTQFDTMAKKTVIKLLLSKFGPLTIEMQKAQTFDQAVVMDADDENSARYVDNDKTDIPDISQAEEVSFEDEAPAEEPQAAKEPGF